MPETLTIVLEFAAIAALVLRQRLLCRGGIRARQNPLQPAPPDVRDGRLARAVCSRGDGKPGRRAFGHAIRHHAHQPRSAVGSGNPIISHRIGPVLRTIGITDQSAITSLSVVLGFSIITFSHIVLGELSPKPSPSSGRRPSPRMRRPR
jgi:hypothetical protein